MHKTDTEEDEGSAQRRNTPEALAETAEGYEGLLDWMVIGFAKTISRQEWQIKNLEAELKRLKQLTGEPIDEWRDGQCSWRV